MGNHFNKIEYLEKIKKSKTLDELFEIWKKKEVVEKRIVSRGQTNFIQLDHAKNGFISDGIVNDNIWNSESQPRILFVMKMLDFNINNMNVDIRPEMRKGRKGKIWSEYKYNTIAKWALGIIRTDKERIEPYEHHNYYEEWWNNISIMGIKKENNSSVIMNPDTVDIYAESNKDEIKKEIEIIDPDIIVCCSVYRTLMTIVYQYDTEEEFTEAFFKSESMLNNWCNVIPINGRNRLFIQYVEPGWPDLITYYGLVNIYQQALINGLIKR